ncbi:MAG: type II toxin-antitoxin system VapC family toxin [Myxococcales bacterium]|nr:type II toxin-antitoxin system VapC family toxin [Myxococcales bacterium]
MIGVDTNVLVRFLVEDDVQQSKRAGQLFRRALAKGEQLFISDVVLCEVVWVLEGAYRVPRGEIAALLLDLARAKQVELGDADIVHRALTAFQAGNGDFADYVIRERALGAGCSALVTFEKKLWAEAGFEKV